MSSSLGMVSSGLSGNAQTQLIENRERIGGRSTGKGADLKSMKKKEDTLYKKTKKKGEERDKECSGASRKEKVNRNEKSQIASKGMSPYS